MPQQTYVCKQEMKPKLFLHPLRNKLKNKWRKTCCDFHVGGSSPHHKVPAKELFFPSPPRVFPIHIPSFLTTPPGRQGAPHSPAPHPQISRSRSPQDSGADWWRSGPQRRVTPRDWSAGAAQGGTQRVYKEGAAAAERGQSERCGGERAWGARRSPQPQPPFPAGDGSSRSVRPRWRRWPTPAMLCYVTRPDAVVMEVEVEAKANGEDCLNQVRGVPRGAGGGLPLFPPFSPLPSVSDAGLAASFSSPLSGPAMVIAFLLHLCEGRAGCRGMRRGLGRPRPRCCSPILTPNLGAGGHEESCLAAARQPGRGPR